jgi:hypothetical protein
MMLFLVSCPGVWLEHFLESDYMKKIKSKDVDYDVKFWKDWLEADPMKKVKLVEKLRLFKLVEEAKSSKIPGHLFASIINGYFEDLESAVYTKIRIENAENQKPYFGIAKGMKKYKHEKISDFD